MSNVFYLCNACLCADIKPMAKCLECGSEDIFIDIEVEDDDEE